MSKDHLFAMRGLQFDSRLLRPKKFSGLVLSGNISWKKKMWTLSSTFWTLLLLGSGFGAYCIHLSTNTEYYVIVSKLSLVCICTILAFELVTSTQHLHTCTYFRSFWVIKFYFVVFFVCFFFKFYILKQWSTDN